MQQFFVIRSQTSWDGRGTAPIPKIVDGPFSLALANHTMEVKNEAEGRATDGPVPYRYSLVEAPN